MGADAPIRAQFPGQSAHRKQSQNKLHEVRVTADEDMQYAFRGFWQSAGHWKRKKSEPGKEASAAEEKQVRSKLWNDVDTERRREFYNPRLFLHVSLFLFLLVVIQVALVLSNRHIC